MANRKRALFEPTDDWQQLQFQLDWTEQTRYELIRPVVVYGRSPVERSQETGLSARTIYRKVSRFDELGMQSLFEAEPDEDKRRLPQVIRQAIVQLKAEYCVRYSGLAHIDAREWPTCDGVKSFPDLREASRWERRHASEEGHGGAVRGDPTRV